VLTLAAGVALVASLLALDRLPAPFVWAAASACALLGAAAFATGRPAVRALWINAGAIVLALGLFEAYLWVRDDPAPEERFEGTYTTEYFVDHALLGYGPAQGVRVTASKYVEDRLVYDVAYTIDAHGLRITPPAAGGAGGSILFFGGSVTFGEGVNDEHAMPYIVAERGAGRYAVHNFAFHGYGPHQMLAALERGLVDQIVDQAPRYVVYQAIPAHVARSAGLASWDRHGPSYELRPDGGVRFAGHFDDSRGAWRDALSAGLERSRAYSSFLGKGRQTRERDIRLYLGVVRAARDAVLDAYPGCEFHVLLWGYEGDPVFDSIRAGLIEAGISTHPVRDILPGYLDAPELYELSPEDKHPNPRAHAIIADYVDSNIVDKGGATRVRARVRLAGAIR
jgi:hypothetical protein